MACLAFECGYVCLSPAVEAALAHFEHAWMRELAPADVTAARATTGKLDWVLIGALVVVIALVSYQQLATTTGARTAQQASVVHGAANMAGTN